MRLLVVMQCVVDPEMLQEILWRRKCVHAVMHTEVGCISCDEATGKRNAVLTEEQPVYQEENGGQCNTHDRRHGQSRLILRKIMMGTVKYVL